MNGSDQLLLKATYALAENGRFTCAPNPTVGCVIVKGGNIVGRGYHHKAGEGHAEVEAIRSAGGDVAGATFYVSLEPCAFEGRTPACAKTLIDVGVRRVVVGTLDPHPKVSGAGVRLLEAAGIQVEVANDPEAKSLIRGYCARIERQRPWVRIKTASSLDGATALANGASQWITCAESRSDVQYWRARSDAIITGIGTVLSDDPALTVRDYKARAPLRVVLDSNLRLPEGAQVATDGGPTLVVHQSGAERQIESDGQPEGRLSPLTPLESPLEFVAGDPRNLSNVLSLLAERGCNEVLVEAGSGVVGSFVEAGLWDEWVAYLAPAIMGQDAKNVAGVTFQDMQSIPRGKIVTVKQTGSDVRITMVPSS